MESSSRTPTPADRQYRRWARVYCDLRDHGRESFGQILRPPDASYNRHLNARGWQDRLDPLRLYEIAEHRTGNKTVYLAPKRRAVGRRAAITLCYRIPFGNDPARAQRQLDFLNHDLHDGLLYVERNDDDGYRAFATYTIPTEPRGDRGTGTHGATAATAAAINAVKEDAQRWLRQVWAQHGWPATIEVRGTLAEVSSAPGSRHKRCERRAELFVAPRCRDDGAVQRLQLSRYPATWVRWFWWPVARLDALVPRSQAGITRSILETAPMRDCAFAALREFFGHTLPRRDLRDAQLERIVRAAMAHWHRRPDRGWHAVLPADVVAPALRGLLRRILRKWRGPAAGRGATGLYFDAFDIDEAESRVRARVSAAALAALNQNPKLRSARVSYRALSVLLCTIAKDSVINDGYVPTSAMRRMLEFWGITTNGSHIKVLVDALKDAGLVEYANSSYRVTDERGAGYCRRYRVTRPVLRITFLKEFLSATGADAASAPDAHVAAPAPAGSSQSCIADEASAGACMKFADEARAVAKVFYGDVTGGVGVPDDDLFAESFDCRLF